MRLVIYLNPFFRDGKVTVGGFYESDSVVMNET
jgi:hypothetical protein